MLRIFFESFKITNSNIITAIPLVAFCTVIILYCQFMSVANDTIGKHLLSIFTLFILASGLLASWLYSVKKFLSDYKKNKSRITLMQVLTKLCGYLLKGVGRLFLPCIGYIALNIMIYSLIFSAAAYLSTSVLAIKLPSNVLFLILFYMTTYLTILWLPELVYNERNALFALYNSIIRVFTEFKDTMSLYIFVFALITLVVAINIHFIFISALSSFLILIVSYYIFLYIVVLLFTYYERKFTESAK